VSDRLAQRLRSAARGRDVGLGYALVVVVVAAVVFAQPTAVSERWILECSTNVENLRARPLLVLALSAFVVSSPWGLWTVPLLVAVLGAVQRWVGRSATVLVAVFGHVLATVFVAVLLEAGIARHVLDRDLAREPDVGVSYVLAAVWGLLLFRAVPRRRRRTGLLVLVGLVGLVLLSETFTDVGHLVAWATGVGIGFVGSRMASALAQDRASDPPRRVIEASVPATDG
jgi:hypothetical protein